MRISKAGKKVSNQHSQQGVAIAEYILIITLLILTLLWFSTTFVAVLNNSYQNHNDQFDYTNVQGVI